MVRARSSGPLLNLDRDTGRTEHTTEQRRAFEGRLSIPYRSQTASHYRDHHVSSTAGYRADILRSSGWRPRGSVGEPSLSPIGAAAVASLGAICSEALGDEGAAERDRRWRVVSMGSRSTEQDLVGRTEEVEQRTLAVKGEELVVDLGVEHRRGGEPSAASGKVGLVGPPPGGCW